MYFKERYGHVVQNWVSIRYINTIYLFEKVYPFDMSVIFCERCNNLLYMRIDHDQSTTLMYHCKNCYFEISEDDLRSKIDLDMTIYDEKYEDDQATYKQFITPFIQDDPTLPHVSNIECANKKCTRPPEKERDVIVIKYDAIQLKYIYHCTYCLTFWKKDNDEPLNKEVDY